MVSIIILSYNTKELILSCLSSLYEKLDGTAFEVIVVDNASKDDSVEAIKKQFSKVQMLENNENVGFAKGVNIGAKVAKGDLLLFLNSDTNFLDTSFSKMLSAYTPEKGIIGGKMVNNDGTFQQSFGSFPSLYIIALTLFKGAEFSTLTTIPKGSENVDWVSGGFMLISKKLFDELNGFDEHFFMYVEDIELCFRVRKKGLKVVYFPDTNVKHVGQGSSNRTFAIVNIYKGLLYFYKKHKSAFEYSILKCMLLTKSYIAIAVGLLQRNTYLVTTYKQTLNI